MNITKSAEILNEEFVHKATHDLKAPVTVIKAYLQLAEMKLKLADTKTGLPPDGQIIQFQEFVAKMNIQLERLITVIDDLSVNKVHKSDQKL